MKSFFVSLFLVILGIMIGASVVAKYYMGYLEKHESWARVDTVTNIGLRYRKSGYSDTELLDSLCLEASNSIEYFESTGAEGSAMDTAQYRKMLTPILEGPCKRFVKES